jgi:glycosyltransferase involved in cell wall biosynthesis
MAARKNILLVSLSSEFGGAEVYLHRLADLLSDKAVFSAVVLNAELASRLQDAGIDDVTLVSASVGKAGIYRSGALATIAKALKIRPHFIHFNGQHETYLAPLARLLGIPFCVTRHNQMDTPPLRPRLKRRFILRQLQHAHAVICVSREIFQELQHDVDNGQLRLISTWISKVGLPRTQFNTTHDPLKLLFVGRLIRQKGIYDLLEAIKLLANVTLDVVGEGPELLTCRAIAMDLPVTFHGFARDISSFLRQADILVFPSHEGYEGLPQVPLEAMASGLPCLFSDIVCSRELMGEQLTHSFRPGDALDLASQVNMLASDRTALIDMSHRGISRVTKTYTRDAVQDAYIAAFSLLKAI